MSDNTLVTLNQSFMCGSSNDENSPGTPVAKFDETALGVALENQQVQSLSRDLGSSFGVIKNPIFLMFTELQKVARYFAGDFVPICKNQYFLKNMKRIWLELITRGYFGEVGICNSVEAREAEKRMVLERGDDGLKREYFPESPIRLYIREQSSVMVEVDGREVERRTYSYKSVGTGCGGLDLSGEKLVRASCNGIYNFFGWGQILLDYFGAHEAFVNCFYTSLKNMIVEVEDDSKYQKEKHQLERSSDTVFARHTAMTGDSNSMGENTYEQFACFPIESVQQVLKNIEMGRDHKSAYYGVFGKNLDQKKERNTVAETGMDFKLVNNIQKSYLLNLECLCRDMIDDLGAPEDFKIVLSSTKPHIENDPNFYGMQQGKFSNETREQFANNKFNNQNYGNEKR